MNPDRLFVRQSQLVAPTLRSASAIVAGVGMVGSWVALLLARQVRSLDVYDDDTVGEENLGTQAYNGSQVGTLKTTAVTYLAQGLATVTAHNRRFPAQDFRVEPPLFVVSAVDSMAGRREIASWSRENADAFVDARVFGELAAIYLLRTPADYRWYLANEIPADDEVPEVTCGATGTPYVGMWLASRIIAALNNHCKGIPERRKTVWHVGLNCEIEQ